MAKYWSFSFSISPSNEYLGLISFRMDWLDLPATQGTLKSLLRHHSLKASVLWCSAFFMVQLSHLYMTTGKNIALTIWTFVGKVMSLLFNTLSRFVIAIPQCKKKKKKKSPVTLDSHISLLFPTLLSARLLHLLPVFSASSSALRSAAQGH